MMKKGPKPKPFMEWVECVPFSTCWYWMGQVDRDGYGKVRFNGKYPTAHRASYEMHIGPISPGLCVCHSCDEPSCVNPDHLWLGTVADNARDREAKGRGRWS